jgi:hypothetical protein
MLCYTCIVGRVRCVTRYYNGLADVFSYMKYRGDPIIAFQIVFIITDKLTEIQRFEGAYESDARLH